MEHLFPYTIKNKDQILPDQPVVYKLNFGSKYFVWKGKTIKSLEQNCTDIYKFVWKPKPGHAFMPMAAYIRKARILECLVEVIIQTEDPKLLIDTERSLLEAGKNDPHCLNEIFEPHVPKWLAEELTLIKPKTKKPNKAITDTFVKKDDKVYQPPVVKSPEPNKNSSQKVNKLLDALDKLN